MKGAFGSSADSYVVCIDVMLPVKCGGPFRHVGMLPRRKPENSHAPPQNSIGRADVPVFVKDAMRILLQTLYLTLWPDLQGKPESVKGIQVSD